MTEGDWLYVNGARIERAYFEANVAEARSYSWERAVFHGAGDHTHCLVCWAAISEGAECFRSDGGWLCAYCFSAFVDDRADLDSLLIDELSHKYSEHDTASFDTLDFLGAFGSPLEALMYARLFHPRFIEFEGMVFRHDVIMDDDDRAAIRSDLRKTNGDRRNVEESFNLVEVPSGLFSKGWESSEEIDEALARSLVESWSDALARAFPTRRFRVMLVSPDEMGGQWGVTFYSIRE